MLKIKSYSGSGCGFYKCLTLDLDPGPKKRRIPPESTLALRNVATSGIGITVRIAMMTPEKGLISESQTNSTILMT